MQNFAPPARMEYSLNQKKKYGRYIFGVFPVQYPKEILWAMNILPVEIWDPPLAISNSNSHLQPYICSIVKLGLELILQGKCEGLDGFLFPHTCDSIQNMASIVNDYLGLDQSCYFFYHPKAPYKESSRQFFLDQSKNLAENLGRQVGDLNTKELTKYIAKGQKIDSLISELYERRAKGEVVCSNVDFYQVLRQGEFLHPDDFLPLLEEFLSFLKGRGPGENKRSVVLSGIMPNPPEILALLDDFGVTIADDDLASCGRRTKISGLDKVDPFEIMAEAYFKMPPCSTKDSPSAERLESILGKVERSCSKGVIFNLVKFCEPELFDAPFLADQLKERGIPALILDTEVNQGLSGQLKTRLEAFVEMIS